MSYFDEFDVSEHSYTDDGWAYGIREVVSSERLLWCAVIHQAFTDALNGSRRARDWLLCDRQDFALVCTLAGMSAFSVRQAARRRIAPFLKSGATQ